MVTRNTPVLFVMFEGDRRARGGRGEGRGNVSFIITVFLEGERGRRGRGGGGGSVGKMCFFLSFSFPLRKHLLVMEVLVGDTIFASSVFVLRNAWKGERGIGRGGRGGGGSSEGKSGILLSLPLSFSLSEDFLVVQVLIDDTVFRGGESWRRFGYARERKGKRKRRGRYRWRDGRGHRVLSLSFPLCEHLLVMEVLVNDPVFICNSSWS
jgi:hypothetical protein